MYMHGKNKRLTAKGRSSRQKQQAYGKNKRLTAKVKTSRQERNLKGTGYYAEIWERKGVQHGAEFHTHVETKMFCANCGTELASAANFCVQCGQGKTVLCFTKFIVIEIKKPRTFKSLCSSKGLESPRYSSH